MQATSLTSVLLNPGYVNAKNYADLRSYFEYSRSGVDLEADGLQEILFGEFLVEQG
ncbi:MAG: hypothetical protein H7269_14020, partial [Cellulomonas sp.]|nr:hypothetical protein [Cellulomonas sp.]